MLYTDMFFLILIKVAVGWAWWWVMQDIQPWDDIVPLVLHWMCCPAYKAAFI